jgi:hypothetical protein
MSAPDMTLIISPRFEIQINAASNAMLMTAFSQNFMSFFLNVAMKWEPQRKRRLNCHREALLAEAIFLQARDCFAEKRSQ